MLAEQTKCIRTIIDHFHKKEASNKYSDFVDTKTDVLTISLLVIVRRNTDDVMNNE